MKRLCLILAFALIAAPPVRAQFGGLKKVLDRAKSLSELHITDEDERALGAAISQNIRDLYGVQQDEAATRYVNLVGRVIAEKTDRPGLDWQFIILDSDSTNAFAAPGGFIHITRGALAVMQSEAELAGVLAHEIAHVTERHTIKSIQKMKGITLADDQTSLTGNSQVFKAVADKATEAILLGFGRGEELESDAVGLELAAACRYAPAGLPKFLETLRDRYSQHQQRAGLFASHPETAERLERIHSLIEKKGLTGENQVLLPERFGQNIGYELAEFAGTGEVLEGARGMAQGGGKDSDKGKEKSGGTLSKLRNPFGSGKREQRAEVTGSAAARGVETELGVEQPGNPALVAVQITAEQLEAFKREGGLA